MGNIEWFLDGQPVTQTDHRNIRAGDVLGRLTIKNIGTRELVNLWIFDVFRRAEFSISENGPWLTVGMPLGQLGAGMDVSVWARAEKLTMMEISMRHGPLGGPMMICSQEGEPLTAYGEPICKYHSDGNLSHEPVHDPV